MDARRMKNYFQNELNYGEVIIINEASSAVGILNEIKGITEKFPDY